MRSLPIIALMPVILACAAFTQKHQAPGSWSREAVSLNWTTRVVSPDKHIRIEVAHNSEETLVVAQIYRDGQKLTEEQWLASGNPELLWSPDSTAFAVTQSDGGSVGPWHVVLYRIADSKVASVPLDDHAAEVRLASTLSPCVIAKDNAAVGDCSDKAKQQYRQDVSWVNVAAIRWSTPDRLLIVGEVPCSSSYGANMCRYRAYEVSVTTGQIFAVLSERQFRRRYGRIGGRWQNPD